VQIGQKLSWTRCDSKLGPRILPISTDVPRQTVDQNICRPLGKL
jgi:hypothetical protein